MKTHCKRARLVFSCLLFFIVLIVLVLPGKAAAQVSMGRDLLEYHQNFDELPRTDTAIWASGTAYLPGWYVQRSIAGTALIANPGTSNSGGLYSYGATNGADRALGSISSLKLGEFAWGLLLQNNTGDTIRSLDVSFYGEQWRISNKTAGQHQIAFFYAVSNDYTSFNLAPGADKKWTPYPELDFKGPKFYMAGGALNGNAPANRRLMAASIPVTIPAGAYVMLRWKDADELEADHGLAIDDFTLRWTISEDQPITVLPVELVRFTAHARGNRVEVAWQTASEEANDHFTVQRSADGKTFSEVGKVYGHGTTSQVSHYTFTDEQPLSGTSFYRLKQVDEDGSATYSGIVSVSSAAATSIASVYPTITSQFLSVEWSGQQPLQQALILDMRGKQVWQQKISGADGLQELDVSSLRSGTYVLVLLDGTGQRSTSRFLKK
ncbi:T9SS type A sorting domain-containing protein [Pontibacter liquoris]|uniref:T9SS type A sorting domain-containing protein n=1 Tax=Pontibacter liquoris TaxID=2905677 RepID=UPI001FA6F041|nr:T9SS type A sorting domain-containing protein [Pontibacter liquoris]